MNLAQMRRDAAAIFCAGVETVDSGRAVRRCLSRAGHLLTAGDKAYDLSAFDHIYVVGAGKAAAAMAQPAEEVLGDRVDSGLVIVKYSHSLPLKTIEVIEASHPVPDAAGLEGTKRIARLLEEAQDKDLVLYLASGGGSALFFYPVEGVTLEEKQRTTAKLIDSGATIHEINAIRKHISKVKGGQTARLAYPAALVTLVLSDVTGDRLDSISSGPTVPDSTTFEDCLRILDKYDLSRKIPQPVLSHLEKGARGEKEETPKPGDPAFLRTQNIVVASNSQAVEACREKARELGYNCLILSTLIEGETREVAKVHAAIAREIVKTGNPVGRPACVLSGGETTVSLQGKGQGGRNQEFVLAAAIDLAGLESVVALSGGTDGVDGPTEAAGAIADGLTISRAKELGMEAEAYLRENDSYHFFKPLGDLLITGPTLTNVMDIRLMLVR